MKEQIFLDTDLGRGMLVSALEMEPCDGSRYWKLNISYDFCNVTFECISESMMVHKLGLYPSVFGNTNYSVWDRDAVKKYLDLIFTETSEQEAS